MPSAVFQRGVQELKTEHTGLQRNIMDFNGWRAYG
jgi:hypothetical protein